MADLKTFAPRWRQTAVVGDPKSEVLLSWLEKRGFRGATVLDVEDFHKEALANADRPFSIPSSAALSAVIFPTNPIYPREEEGENNAVIAHLLRRGIRIAASLDTSVRASFARKNVGEVISSSASFYSTEKDSASSSSTKRVVAYDGIIGAGKTTRLKEIEKGKDAPTIFYEPSERIYETIRDCTKRGVSREERQRAVEEAIEEYEVECFRDLKSASSTVLIERNWIYSRWIFGVDESPFPSPSAVIASAIEKAGWRFEGTVMIWTSPEESFERTKKRGTADGITLEEERRLESRLSILFKCPYEWRYGAVLTSH